MAQKYGFGQRWWKRTFDIAAFKVNEIARRIGQVLFSWTLKIGWVRKAIGALDVD